MYRFIIERGDKIVHLRVQKYSQPVFRCFPRRLPVRNAGIFAVQKNARTFYLKRLGVSDKTLRRLNQNA